MNPVGFPIFALLFDFYFLLLAFFVQKDTKIVNIGYSMTPMLNITTLNPYYHEYFFDSQLETYIQGKVGSGMYHSASEVVREGLRLLQEQDQLKALRLNQLQQHIETGLQGTPELLDMALLKEKAKSKG
jgi:antitoxin ParD1/3/4